MILTVFQIQSSSSLHVFSTASTMFQMNATLDKSILMVPVEHVQLHKNTMKLQENVVSQVILLFFNCDPNCVSNSKFIIITCFLYCINNVSDECNTGQVNINGACGTCSTTQEYNETTRECGKSSHFAILQL